MKPKALLGFLAVQIALALIAFATVVVAANLGGALKDAIGTGAGLNLQGAFAFGMASYWGLVLGAIVLLFQGFSTWLFIRWQERPLQRWMTVGLLAAMELATVFAMLALVGYGVACCLLPVGVRQP